MSSTMSESGEVYTRCVNPLPGLTLAVDIVLAPTIRSFAWLVVAEPLLSLVPLPLAPATASNAVYPLY